MSQLLKNIKLPNRPNRSIGVSSNIPERAEAIKNNQKLFFTGKPCKHGHVAPRFTNNGTCKECHRIIAQKNQIKYHLKRHFNITEAEYMALCEKQYGVCAICKEEETIIDGQTKEVKPLSVDHCHNTGKIRGLLCTKCNLGISYFNHEPYLLRNAALYCEEK